MLKKLELNKKDYFLKNLNKWVKELEVIYFLFII